MISPVTSHSEVQEQSHFIVQDPPQQRPGSGIEKFVIRNLLSCSVNYALSAQFRTAVLNLFRLADHLTNFVSVRGPPKVLLYFLGKISEFLTTLFSHFPKFVIGSRTSKKNFANFPNFLAFFRVKDRKTFQIPFAI